MPGKHNPDSPAGRRIEAIIAAQAPISVARLVELSGYHTRTVRDQILARHRDGQVHVAEYRREYDLSAAPSKLWAPGPGQDAAPQRRPRSRMANWATSSGAARILERLTCGPCTIKTLCADCAIGDNAARTLLKQIVSAGAIHLSGHIIPVGIGGMHSKVYSIGPGKPAKRKPRRPKKILYQEWRARKINQYGQDVAQSMLRSRRNGGADRIVIDGKTVYQRRPA